MELIAVPLGEVELGERLVRTPENPKWRSAGSLLRVRVSQPFTLARHEVTNHLYETVTGSAFPRSTAPSGPWAGTTRIRR